MGQTTTDINVPYAIILSMAKVKSQAQLKKELDKYFSIYIRRRDKGQCYTCPKKDDPKWMRCGHFVPRQYLATRYDEANCHCQCYACNCLYNGQPSAYASRLEKEYGAGTVARLESLRKQITKDFPFAEKIVYYKELSTSPIAET